MRSAILLLFCALSAVCGGVVAPAKVIVQRALEEHDHGGHDGHDHGESTDPWEWAGIFDTSAGNYIWTAQKVNGDDGMAYADPTMKFVILSAPAATEEALEELQAEARHGFEVVCTEVEAGERFVDGGRVLRAALRRHDHRLLLLHHRRRPFRYLHRARPHRVRAAGELGHPLPARHQRRGHRAGGGAAGGARVVGLVAVGCLHRRRHHCPHLHPRRRHLHRAPGAHSRRHRNHDCHGPLFSEREASSCITRRVGRTAPARAFPQVGALAEKYPAPLSIGINSFAAGALISAAFYLMLYEATHLITYQEESEVIITRDYHG